GNKLLQEHKYDEALQAFQEGFRTYPDSTFILNEASTLFEAGRYSEAKDAYQRYLSGPDARRGKEAQAMIERSDKAIAKQEASKEFEKASVAYKEGRYQEALEGFEKANELSPNPDYKYNQADCLDKLGRPYAAADRYSEYLAEKPDATDAGK